MISQLNKSVAETKPTGQALSPAQIKNSTDIPLEIMKRASARNGSVRGGAHLDNSKYLETYIERRKKLTARIRAEHPTFTDSEIEERLEQFGA
jgi:hypothetical protein